MGDERIRRAFLEELARIAPEVDLATLEPHVDLREQIDLDSMDVLNLVIGLGEALSLEIPESDMTKLVTLDRGVDYLSKRLAARQDG